MLRDHVFYCREEHDETTTTIHAPLGEAPSVPVCIMCGELMKKEWGTPVVVYSGDWKFRSPLRGKGKFANK